MDFIWGMFNAFLLPIILLVLFFVMLVGRRRIALNCPTCAERIETRKRETELACSKCGTRITAEGRNLEQK
jgi:DNA-directed RNA polymerase subunit RPC12/RpoP